MIITIIGLQSSNGKNVRSKIRSCALIVDILYTSFDFYVCYNFNRCSLAFVFFSVWKCTWGEQDNTKQAKQAIDSCAQHKVHVTMCISLSFQYRIRVCDYFYFYFVAPRIWSFFSTYQRTKKVSPGDLFRFFSSIHFWLRT